MGVLYFADNLTATSVLWMRRMLELLGEDVAVLASEQDPGPRFHDRYETVVVEDSPWAAAGWRLARRFRLVPSLRKTGRAVRTLAAAVDSERVSRVLAHYLTVAVKYDRVWARTDKPVFIHCHGYDVTWDLRWYSDPGRPAHDADYTDRVRALPGNVHFIANSEETKRRILDVGIAEHRIHVKVLGSPIPAEAPVRDAGGEEIVILYLGRLIDCKGPELVIRAFDLASRKGMKARLWMAGDGPLREECESARGESSFSDRIELLGMVDARRAAELRRRAHVFTAHNRRGPVTGQEEAFGVSFVEAMADGLPVISGASGSLPEIVDDGEQGILVEPGDVEAHAEAFLLLAADPELRRRMGTAGWKRARERFSLERERETLRQILGLRAPSDDALTATRT